MAKREDRYDAAEVVLEIALIICSLTLLTKKKFFWFARDFDGDSGFGGGVEWVFCALMAIWRARAFGDLAIARARGVYGGRI